MVSKMQKDYLTDLAVISVGGVTGMAVNQAVSSAWQAANLPIIGVGTFNIDNALVLAGEGLLGYYLYKKGYKNSSKFVIGMFGMSIALELGQAILSALTPITRAVAVSNQRLAGITNSQLTRYAIN